MKKSLYIFNTLFFVLGTLTLPLVVSAQRTFRDVVVSTVSFASEVLIPFLFAVALALFIWGVVDFIQSADNKDKREKGKARILWGIFALFAMIAYLGLTAVLTGTFFGTGVFIPQFFS